jgi:outer membrane protein OmpA-like peptidoglycan-associated protein
MRIHLAVCLALVGCAASQPAAPAKKLTNWYCDPCTLPCSWADECGGRSAAVTFSPAGGTYTKSQTVALSTPTRGAKIYYTTDGSEPTPSSRAYLGPITVASDTTIKAISTAPEMASSAVSSSTYAFDVPTMAPLPPAPILLPVPVRVEVTKERLEIKDRIQFATGKTTLLTTSYPLLDEVAQVLNAHEEVALVEIQGHTDSRGATDANQKLSQGRAESVRTYLVGKGVAPGRLDAKGYGESRPIADNATAGGREANRRVEFTIAPPK